MTANITHWDARVDLAAAFRWCVKLNLHEAVANHFSLAVNPEGTRFLINPNGRHFARITASSLVEIDANDPETMNRPDAPDPTAWGLHGSIHRALPHARCVMHVHSIHATVLASLADSTLPPMRASMSTSSRLQQCPAALPAPCSIACCAAPTCACPTARP